MSWCCCTEQFARSPRPNPRGGAGVGCTLQLLLATCRRRCRRRLQRLPLLLTAPFPLLLTVRHRWNQWEAVEAASGALELFGASLPPDTTGPQLLRQQLDRAVANGFSVVRAWVSPVTAQYALQTSPGQYNEAVFRGLDYLLDQVGCCWGQGRRGSEGEARLLCMPDVRPRLGSPVRRRHKGLVDCNMLLCTDDARTRLACTLSPHIPHPSV